MKHELAKELKDAGFPQEGTLVFASRAEMDLFIHEHSKVAQQDPETRTWKAMPYAPTLSELIEACGEGFEGLVRHGLGWSAAANYPNYGTGSTPEEAVARLWLMLNK